MTQLSFLCHTIQKSFHSTTIWDLMVTKICSTGRGNRSMFTVITFYIICFSNWDVHCMRFWVLFHFPLSLLGRTFFQLNIYVVTSPFWKAAERVCLRYPRVRLSGVLCLHWPRWRSSWRQGGKLNPPPSGLLLVRSQSQKSKKRAASLCPEEHGVWKLPGEAERIGLKTGASQGRDLNSASECEDSTKFL